MGEILCYSLHSVSGKTENKQKTMKLYSILEGDKCMEKDRAREGESGVLGERRSSKGTPP